MRLSGSSLLYPRLPVEKSWRSHRARQAASLPVPLLEALLAAPDLNWEAMHKPGSLEAVLSVGERNPRAGLRDPRGDVIGVNWNP